MSAPLGRKSLVVKNENTHSMRVKSTTLLALGKKLTPRRSLSFTKSDTASVPHLRGQPAVVQADGGVP